MKFQENNQFFQVTLPDLVGESGLFVDGDWVESKDQDPHGDVRLIQLADIGIGEYLNKSARFMTSTKAKELRCSYLMFGDILIARMPDPIGRACIFPGEEKPCVTVVDVCILRPDQSIVDSGWLLHKINSSAFSYEITKWITGTTRQRISRGNLSKISFPLPPLAEQKRIAAILDKSDAIRRKRREAIQLADEFLRSVFLDMFGDPATNPKGWQRKKIRQLGKVVTGNTPSRQILENYGEHIEWIKSDNINTPSHILTKAEEALSEAGEKLGRTVPANSTLVTCIAGTPECIGNAALADRKVAFNQQINAIVPFENVDPYFLYLLVIISKKIIQRASTNSMKGMVSKGIYQEIELISPPYNLQKKFGSHFYAYLNHLEKQEIQLKESDNLFNSLCQKSFRGEL